MRTTLGFSSTTTVRGCARRFGNCTDWPSHASAPCRHSSSGTLTFRRLRRWLRRVPARTVFSRRHMASLRELQSTFAAAMRDPAVACAVVPQANLAIYRNNSAQTFRVALEGTFPVVLKRVGADYFRQLAARYR